MLFLKEGTLFSVLMFKSAKCVVDLATDVKCMDLITKKLIIECYRVWLFVDWLLKLSIAFVDMKM